MKRNSKLLRTLSVLAVIALVCLGLALHTGTGTPSCCIWRWPVNTVQHQPAAG